jgi:hypothetical protein
MQETKLRMFNEAKPASIVRMEDEARQVVSEANLLIEAKVAAKAKAKADNQIREEEEVARTKARAEARARDKAEEEARIEAAGADQWFYIQKDEHLGPVTLAEMRDKISSLTTEPPVKLVWTEGMHDWKPAYEVRKLCEPGPSAQIKPAIVFNPPVEPRVEVKIESKEELEAKALERANAAAAARREEILRSRDAQDARIAAAERAQSKTGEPGKHRADSVAKAAEEARKAAASAARAKVGEDANALAEAKLQAAEHARAAAEARASEEAKLRATAEAKAAQESQLRAAAEAKAAADAKTEAARVRAEATAVAEAAAKLREVAATKAAEEIKLRAAEATAKAEKEAHAKLQAEAKLKATQEALANAEAKAVQEANLRAAAEAQAAHEAKARAEAEAMAAEKARLAAAAEAQAKAEEESKAKAEAEANAAEQAKLKAEAETKAKALSEAEKARAARESEAVAQPARKPTAAKPERRHKPVKGSHKSIWFYTFEGERLGPVSFDALRKMVEDSKLDPRLDMVWKESMDAWKPAGQIDGLFERSSVPVAPKESLAPRADIIRPPQPAPRAALGKNQSWPGARRRSLILATLVFPFAWQYAIAVTSPYLVKEFGGVLMGKILPVAALLPLLVLVHFALQRLVNLGMSRLWLLAVFAPFLNLWLGFRCFACPPGYAYHKKLDGPGVALAILYGLSALAAVLLLAAFTALLFGLVKSPEQQEILRGLVRSLRMR